MLAVAAEPPRKEQWLLDGHHDDGGERGEFFVGVGRAIVFLEDELESVGDGLAQAMHGHVFEAGDDAKSEADAVWSDAVLDPACDFALEENEVGDSAEDG